MQRAETERPTTRTTATSHHPPCPRCLCCVCCALPCRVRCAPCSQVHNSARCHLFLFTRSRMTAPIRSKHDEIEKRGVADGPQGRAQVQRNHDALVCTRFQNCAKGTHWDFQPPPSTDTVMLPSSVRTMPTAVGHLSCGIPQFTHEPLQFEATTMTWAHHPRVLHDDQRAARIFWDLETDRRAHDDRVRGDPVVHGREPVPHSGTVHRSAHHSLRPAPRRYQLVRVLGGTNKGLCVGEVLQVERDGETRGDPQVRRQVIDELL